jgi:membrane associated rhomboid family serine protease
MHGRGYGGGQGSGMGMGFGPPVTPPVVKQLMIANAVVYVAAAMIPGIQLYGSVFPFLVWQQGFLWQPFTYMWLHGSLGHIAMNMFVLWMFGSQVALVWGAKRFLRYYLLCGVGAGVIIATFPYILVGLGIPASLSIPTVGASGAVYGVVLAYSLTWPDRTIMLIFPPMAIRAIWIIPVMFGMTIMMGGSNVSHIGHLGGVVAGWLYLRRDGHTSQAVSLDQLKARWHRYRMRRKLRAVHYEDQAARKRDRDEDHKNTFH